MTHSHPHVDAVTTYRARLFITSISDTMAKPKITLYVDTVSPFGYIAYYVLRVGGTKSSHKGAVTKYCVTPA